MLKVAIVRDGLGEFGGSERTLQVLLEIFPEADIYTSFCDYEMVRKFYPTLDDSKLFVSWAQKKFLYDHGSLMQFLSPLIWRSFRFDKFDVVLSMPASLLCNLVTIKKGIHIQYIQALPQYLLGLLPPTRIQRLTHNTTFILNLYKKALLRSPYIVANSIYTQSFIKEEFGVKSKVIYHPIDVPNSLPKVKHKSYFLCVSRLSREKGMELVIHAFNCLKLPLKIVGKSFEEDYERYLKSLAGPTVEFVGFKSGNDLCNLYQHAVALINPSRNEEFGMSAIEAMAYGVPVIAHFSGGLKETVIPDLSGTFFYNYSVQSLVKVLKQFKRNRFQRKIIFRHARKFRKSRFKKEFKNYVYSCVEI